MATAPDPTPQATPPNPAPAEPSHTERLHKAQSVELERLRAQMADLPDAEALAALKAKAEKFDQISQQLPQWQQQLSQLHQQEVAQLQAQHQTAQQQLQAAKFDVAAAGEFSRAGGLMEHWREFANMMGSRLTAGPDGAPLLDGQPLGDAFKTMVANDPHSILSAFARPRYGSGSGARAGRDGRAVSGQNLSLKNTSKSDLFAQAFGGGR